LRYLAYTFVSLVALVSACKTPSGDSALKESADPQIEPNQKSRIVTTVKQAASAVNSALRLKGRDGGLIVTPELIAKTNCVIGMQVDRGALLLGGSGGQGLMSCRTGTGWSAPSFMQTGGFDLGAGIGWERLQTVVFVADPNLATTWKQNGSFTVGTYAKAIAADAAVALKSADQYGLAVVQASNGGLYAGVGVSFNSLDHAQQTRNQPVYGELLGGGTPEDSFGRQCSAYILPGRRNNCIYEWERRTGKKAKAVSPAEILQTPADNAPMITKPFNDELRQMN
jgi:lipid-binding SYLF domain-containing protein